MEKRKSENKGRTTFTRRVIGTIMRNGFTKTGKIKMLFRLECGHAAQRAVEEDDIYAAQWPVRLKCGECVEAFLHIAKGEPPWSKIPADVTRSGEIKAAVLNKMKPMPEEGSHAIR